jgi:hypothetical protein
VAESRGRNQRPHSNDDPAVSQRKKKGNLWGAPGWGFVPHSATEKESLLSPQRKEEERKFLTQIRRITADAQALNLPDWSKPK